MHRHAVVCLLLGLLVACSQSADVMPPDGVRKPDPDANVFGDGGADGPGLSPDGGVPGCTWISVPISATPIATKSELAFAISSTGERAVAYTAMIGNRHDVVVARGMGGTFTTIPYGLNLIVQSFNDIAATYTSNGVLRIAYSNERNDSTIEGGVYYAAGPGSSLLIDGGGSFGRAGATELAIGPDGRAHVAYTVSQPLDRRLVVATVTGTSIAIAPVIIDPDLSGENSIAIDTGGNVHVTARDLDPTSVLYARRAGTAWSAPSLVTVGGNHSGASLAITPSMVHVSRLDDGRILHARGSAGTWQVTSIPHSATSIDPVTAFVRAAALDASGQLHIAWADQMGKLVYQRFGQPPVTLASPGNPRVREIRIAFGPTGPQIAYATGTAATPPFTVSVARCE